MGCEACKNEGDIFKFSGKQIENRLFHVKKMFKIRNLQCQGTILLIDFLNLSVMSVSIIPRIFL